MSTQSATNRIDVGNIFTVSWFPNLIYSYWLDKLMFAKSDNFIFNDSDYVIASKLKSVPVLEDTYNKYAKITNHSKRYLKNWFTVILSFLAALIITSLSSIITWITQSASNIQFETFIFLFWIVLTIISLIYFYFITVNNFQLIKQDDEHELEQEYDSIIISFKNNINEVNRLYILGLLRKTLLYYWMPKVDNIMEFTINNEIYRCILTHETVWQKYNIFGLNIEIEKVSYNN